MNDFNHPPIVPESMHRKELIRYCEDHADPWVRSVAKMASDMHYYIPTDQDPDVYFSEQADELYEARQNYKYAQEELDKAAEEITKYKDRYDALRYDLNSNTQYEEIESLKARCITRDEQHYTDIQSIRKLERNLTELCEEHDELTAKYNTWTVISTE